MCPLGSHYPARRTFDVSPAAYSSLESRGINELHNKSNTVRSHTHARIPRACYQQSRIVARTTGYSSVQVTSPISIACIGSYHGLQLHQRIRLVSPASRYARSSFKSMEAWAQDAAQYLFAAIGQRPTIASRRQDIIAIIS